MLVFGTEGVAFFFSFKESVSCSSDVPFTRGELLNAEAAMDGKEQLFFNTITELVLYVKPSDTLLCAKEKPGSVSSDSWQPGTVASSASPGFSIARSPTSAAAAAAAACQRLPPLALALSTTFFPPAAGHFLCHSVYSGKTRPMPLLLLRALG
jgi:hypothetical protein